MSKITITEPKYAIGQQYTPRGGRYVCTVVNIHRTFNAAGEMVKLRYVVKYEFCGQIVEDRDVREATITTALEN